MNITFDKEADALYIKLQPSKKTKKTVVLREGVLVDYDASGKVFGIEILDASQRMPLKELAKVITNLPSETKKKA